MTSPARGRQRGGGGTPHLPTLQCLLSGCGSGALRAGPAAARPPAGQPRRALVPTTPGSKRGHIHPPRARLKARTHPPVMRPTSPNSSASSRYFWLDSACCGKGKQERSTHKWECTQCSPRHGSRTAHRQHGAWAIAWPLPQAGASIRHPKSHPLNPRLAFSGEVYTTRCSAASAFEMAYSATAVLPAAGIKRHCRVARGRAAWASSSGQARLPARHGKPGRAQVRAQCALCCCAWQRAAQPPAGRRPHLTYAPPPARSPAARCTRWLSPAGRGPASQSRCGRGRGARAGHGCLLQELVKPYRPSQAPLRKPVAPPRDSPLSKRTHAHTLPDLEWVQSEGILLRRLARPLWLLQRACSQVAEGQRHQPGQAAAPRAPGAGARRPAFLARHPAWPPHAQPAAAPPPPAGAHRAVLGPAPPAQPPHHNPAAPPLRGCTRAVAGRPLASWQPQGPLGRPPDAAAVAGQAVDGRALLQLLFCASSTYNLHLRCTERAYKKQASKRRKPSNRKRPRAHLEAPLLLFQGLACRGRRRQALRRAIQRRRRHGGRCSWLRWCGDSGGGVRASPQDEQQAAVADGGGGSGGCSSGCGRFRPLQLTFSPR